MVGGLEEVVWMSLSLLWHAKHINPSMHGTHTTCMLIAMVQQLQPHLLVDVGAVCVTVVADGAAAVVAVGICVVVLDAVRTWPLLLPWIVGIFLHALNVQLR